MLNIILCGAPGAGKGTQSDFIVEKYGLTHISTGDLIRATVAAGGELGEKLNGFISQGQLVPDAIIIEMLEKHIDSLPADTKGIIFDGFPRTLPQAEELERLMTAKGQPIVALIDIIVEREELIRRLLFRGQTSGRSDDNLETIEKRLVVYHNQTEPVAEYYKKLGKYKSIVAMGTIPENVALMDEVIKTLL